MSVCGVCGVEIAEAKTRRLVHLEDIPQGFDPDHQIVAIGASDFRSGMEARLTLKGAAEDMLHHHAGLCPASTCAWDRVLREALKQS